MRKTKLLVSLACLCTLVVVPLVAQKADLTPGQFYMKYRTVFQSAKSLDEVLPYLTKTTGAKFETTPADQRQQALEMVQAMMSQLADVKVANETKVSETEYTLEVTGLNSEKAVSSGTVQIVKEDGAWKVSSETWDSWGIGG